MTMRSGVIRGLAFGLVLTIAGCKTVGPDYKRPVVVTPDGFRGSATDSASDPASLADAKWATLFADEPLRDLISTALQQNGDIGPTIRVRMGEPIRVFTARDLDFSQAPQL